MPLNGSDDSLQVVPQTAASGVFVANLQDKIAKPPKGCLSVCGIPPRGDPLAAPARPMPPPQPEGQPLPAMRLSEEKAFCLDNLVDASCAMIVPSSADVKCTKYMTNEVSRNCVVGAPGDGILPDVTVFSCDANVPGSNGTQTYHSPYFCWANLTGCGAPVIFALCLTDLETQWTGSNQFLPCPPGRGHYFGRFI